jgi:hypothetical protein
MKRKERIRVLKYLAVEGLALLAAIYLVLSIGAFLGGASDSGYTNKYSNDLDQCYDTPLRIEQAFPSYRLGCYIFGLQGKSYDYWSLKEVQNERSGN